MQSTTAIAAWPRLGLDDWAPTQTTLQRWTQIVGKTRLALAPMQNHWWQVVLYVTERGLDTSPIPYDGRTFDVTFDLMCNAHWTPTVLELDPNGEEFYRLEGFLPLDDFLAQLKLGRAHMDFKQGNWADAEKRFREIADELPNTDAAPEAMYWEGVSRYKATHDATALKETAKAFTQRYTESSWAKKASIWA